MENNKFSLEGLVKKIFSMQLDNPIIAICFCFDDAKNLQVFIGIEKFDQFKKMSIEGSKLDLTMQKFKTAKTHIQENSDFIKTYSEVKLALSGIDFMEKKIKSVREMVDEIEVTTTIKTLLPAHYLTSMEHENEILKKIDLTDVYFGNLGEYPCTSEIKFQKKYLRIYRSLGELKIHDPNKSRVQLGETH
jgi:hypothetical protein